MTVNTLTWRFLSSTIRVIWIFFLPIAEKNASSNSQRRLSVQQSLAHSSTVGSVTPGLVWHGFLKKSETESQLNCDSPAALWKVTQALIFMKTFSEEHHVTKGLRVQHEDRKLGWTKKQMNELHTLLVSFLVFVPATSNPTVSIMRALCSPWFTDQTSKTLRSSDEDCFPTENTSVFTGSHRLC